AKLFHSPKHRCRRRKSLRARRQIHATRTDDKRSLVDQAGEPRCHCSGFFDSSVRNGRFEKKSAQQRERCRPPEFPVSSKASPSTKSFARNQKTGPARICRLRSRTCLSASRRKSGRARRFSVETRAAGLLGVVRETWWDRRPQGMLLGPFD